ncbi:hypothetical protein PRNP1_007941 [Phytophthora ramorum]
MELSAWREVVPYGDYLQSIHLQVADPKSTHASSSCGKESPSQSSQNTRQTSQTPAEAPTSGTPSLPSPPEVSSAAKTTQYADDSTQNTTKVLLLPPFGSEILNQGEQMALNVGGPVWAMDWLPSKPAADAAAVAASLVKSKQKKPRRASAASNNGSKRAAKGKENNKVETPEGETTAASNGSPEAEEDVKLEWRFLALATHPPCQVEDGKVVKATPPDHYYDVPESGRNLIQIWAVPVRRPKATGTGQHKGEAAKRRLVKPRMVHAIDHDYGVAWDLQWCPLVKKFPKTDRRQNILGILAACFGDGTVRVLEVPGIPEERLQVDVRKEAVVEKNVAVMVAKLPRILQLSVQWSPHNWNMLLSGGSDGSVSMWNIKSAISGSDSLVDDRVGPEPIEPQRRFQDADTIGKQEAFDWGCGWVAIRAVAWSPFDEHLFATTGNDSVFKVWDIREPRVCLRSHRIRSTWGLALQWMDQTSIQISGDQGSVYMYDILSGSYQKLHFHPQIDSPVWDLQFARRGPMPLLISSCTSGSIRAAPAKKLYRAPQTCVEICRLSGEKDSSVEKPFKSLTLSLDKHSVVGSADTGSLNTREFCERDAALHRLRLSSSTAGDYPCYMAAGGQAGLVILLEMQEVLDTLIPTFFLPPSKKIGRPKKTMFAPVGGRHVSQTGSPIETEGVPVPTPIPVTTVSAGRKAHTLGSFAKAKGMRTALSKYKKKSSGKGKARAGSRAKAKLSDKTFIQDDGEVEFEDSIEDEKEPEFEEEEEDEEEDESDLSLMMGESSDDDRISVSDDEIEEEETATPNTNPEEARLMKEYQLDLSEEDAYLLALQMSKIDDVASAPGLEVNADVPSSATVSAVASIPHEKDGGQKESIKTKPKTKAKSKTTAAAKTAAKTKTAMKVRATAKPKATMKVAATAKPKSTTKVATTAKTKTAARKRARPSKATTKTLDIAAEVAPGVKASDANQRDDSGEAECKAPTPSPALAAEKEKAVAPSATGTPFAPKKVKKTQPKKTSVRKLIPKSKKDSPMLREAINQAMALQAFEYQLGMSEEYALKEALRLSEMEGSNRRSSRTKQPVSHLTSEPVGTALPTPTQPKQKTPATPRTKGPSRNKTKKTKELKELQPKNDAASGEDPQRQRPQTPRRLHFSPLNGSEGGDHAVIPVSNINGDTPTKQPAAPHVDSVPTAKALPKKPSPKKSPVVKSAKKPSPRKSPVVEAVSKKASPKKTLAAGVAKPEQKQPAKSPASAKKASSEVKLPASASVADAPAPTPEGKKPAKRSRSTGAKASAGSKAVKKRKKTTTPRSGQRDSDAAQGGPMSEEDALLLALKMSEIEY